jgi:CBS domain-containing protein
MIVRNVMTPRPETIGPGETLQEAARRMRDLGVGLLVVREQEELLGVLTDRDIVVRGVALGRDPSATRVRSAMTPQLITCRADDDLEEAVARMEAGAVRRAVVLDEEQRPVGLLSVDDVALGSPALAGEVIEHLRAPERPVKRGSYSWWEEAGG